MRRYSDLTVSANTTIREVMSVIDRGAVEIALVTGEMNRLLGTITDGDIRRAILRGTELEAPASKVMHARFISVGPETSQDEVLGLMRSQGIKQVPVLDAQQQLLGLHLLQDLVGRPDLPNWTVVMAGGEGRRLHPLTFDVPKPMLPVGDRPLLERTIRRLVDHGFRRIFLSVHYLSHQIEEHFLDGSDFSCRIEFLREEQPLGTGGALRLLPEAPTHPLLVINGDLFTEVNFGALLDYHVHSGYSATVCVRDFTYQVPYGVVRVEGHRVLDVEEKPLQRFLINAGMYVLDPSVLSLVPRSGPFALPALLAEMHSRNHPVGAFPVREYWVDIGHLADYERIQAGLNDHTR